MAIVCTICGSDDVQVKRWVNANTDLPEDEGMFNLNEIEDNYCVSCDEHTVLKEHKDAD